MKSHSVKNMMVALEEYETISQDATLQEAVVVLDKAQAEFGKHPHEHRALLVVDGEGRIVGKLSQHDFIKALEPNYERMEKEWKIRLSRFGGGDPYVKNALKEFGLWQKPLQNLCARAFQVRVKDIMYTPGEGEFVDVEASMDEAIHRMIIGRHHSLLVIHEEEIVGILRLADVFELVSQEMKQCRQVDFD